MNRRDSFEAAYAASHDLPIETFSQYRMGDTYRLPMIAKCWRFWNLALDSVLIGLPEKCEFAEPGGDYHKGYRQGVRAMVEIAETAGLKVSN